MKSFCESRMNKFQIIFHHLFKLHRALFISLISDIELFPGQIPILALLNKNDGCIQKEIGENLRFKPASITDSLKRMEKALLIIRKQDEKDLRITRVYITDTGRQQLEKAIDISNRLEDICFAGFTKEEKEVFINSMEKMSRNLDKEGVD
jgi:Transcriptional regulators